MTSIKIEKCVVGYGSLFDVTVCDARPDLANKIHEVVSVEMGLIPTPEPNDAYVDVRGMPNYQHEALLRAAKLFFAYNENKISTIKFIRSLINTAPLLEAKQLVDYALGGDKPTWFKLGDSV